MPIMNVAFLNANLQKKSGGGSGINILTDQLTILENQLKADGILTSGDYDLLMESAQKIMNTGGLTKSQKSDIQVKISTYESNKKVASLQRSEDIPAILRSIQNEGSEDVMTAGNDPQKFLQGRIASIQSALTGIQDIMERRVNAGDDVSQFMNEYNSLLQDYQNKSLALQASQTWQDGNTDPIPGYAAFVKTNNRGEIIDVDYAPSGSKSGYSETTAMINGFQVFGSPNVKSNGESKFILGSDIYSGVDYAIDPNTGMAKAGKLYAQSQQSGSSMFKKGTEGFINYDPTKIATQGAVLRGDWAKTTDGTVYYRREDGGYDKHINAASDMPGRPPLDSMLTIPSIMRKSLDMYSDNTIDDSAPISPDGVSGPYGPFNPGSSMSAASTPAIARGPMSTEAPGFSGSQISTPQMSQAPMGTPKTNKPVERAPQSAQGIANRTMKSGVDLVRTPIA